jgi:glycosyltransferase involved in cell wall biosynthesis
MVSHRDRAKFDYEVAYVLEAENALVPEVEAAGVRVHSLGASWNGDMLWTLRLRALLRAGNFDIVHTHLPYAATLGRLVAASLAPRRRPAVVYTEHSQWDKMALALKALNRATIGFDDRLLVVSEAARQSLPPALRKRATVVIHGIDLEPVRAVQAQRKRLREEVRGELGLHEGDLLVLTVANLRPEKGYDVLLQAARSVIDRADRQVPVKFASVGRGPLREAVMADRERLALGEDFQFLGERTDVLRLLAACDVFVLASRHEGLPVSVMEAICTGVPIVATAVGELPNLLTDGDDALLVPPEQPELLADAIDRVAADGTLRHRLATASLARAPLFDVARCVREVEAIYRELCPVPKRATS